MSNKLRVCELCGDDIPLHTRICPFCYYVSKEGHYDFDSSPYLMMMDLRSLCRELVEMDKIKMQQGLYRAFTFRKIDPNWRDVLQIKVTFEVVQETVSSKFGRVPIVIDSLLTFEGVLEEALAERYARVGHIRSVVKVILMIFTLLFVVAFGITLFHAC